jgi:hypothetical protein
MSLENAAPAPRRSQGHTKPRAPLISLHEPGRLYVANLMAIYGLSHSALYERLRDGRLPAPDGRDGRRPYWSTDTVLAHLSRAAEGNEEGEA